MKKNTRHLPVEVYKRPASKVIPGFIFGFIVGYLPYVVHMNQWLT
jgi:hypothetical protein